MEIWLPAAIQFAFMPLKKMLTSVSPSRKASSTLKHSEEIEFLSMKSKAPFLRPSSAICHQTGKVTTIMPLPDGADGTVVLNRKVAVLSPWKAICVLLVVIPVSPAPIML